MKTCRVYFYLVLLCAMTVQCKPRQKKADYTDLSPAKQELLPKQLTLKEGENTFLKESGFNISFRQITEDSSCPKDVQCIWEGVATAEIEVMGIYTRPQKFYLSTISDPRKKLQKKAKFSGYEIELISIFPNKKSANSPHPINYRLTLNVSKLTTK